MTGRTEIAFLIGKVRQQDRVVDSDTDESEQAEHDEEADLVVGDQQPTEHAEEAERDREEHQQPLDARPELHDEQDCHEDQRHAEGDRHRAERLLIVALESKVESERVLFEAKARQRVGVESLFDKGLSLCGQRGDVVVVESRLHLDVAAAFLSGDRVGQRQLGLDHIEGCAIRTFDHRAVKCRSYLLCTVEQRCVIVGKELHLKREEQLRRSSGLLVEDHTCAIDI